MNMAVHSNDLERYSALELREVGWGRDIAVS